ncbi:MULTISPECIES: hypothetical protein [Sorangium]|uniref:hypothetical protein n=1 Tax=Sorangium TaxID=39643 RepID=UPI003D9BFE31
MSISPANCSPRETVISRRPAMPSVLRALLMGWLCAGCGAQLELDPKLAPRAEELPMETPDGFFPPEYIRIGPYRVTAIDFEREGSFALKVSSVKGSFGGDWRLRAAMTGPDMPAGSIYCTGPSNPWMNRGKYEHLGVGTLQLGCHLNDGTRAWAMRFDVDLNSTWPQEPEWVPEWLKAMRKLWPSKPDRRLLLDWDALLRSEDGRVLLVEWAHQTVRPSNVGGYYVMTDGNIVGAADVTPGYGRTYIARDAPPALRPAVAVTLAAIHMLVYVHPERAAWLMY